MRKNIKLSLKLALFFALMVVFATNVFAADPISKITLTATPKSVTLMPGDTRIIEAKVTPTAATSFKIISSDENVAEVMENAGTYTLKPRSPGKATIIAMATDGSGVIGTLTVTVQMPREISALSIAKADMPGINGTVTVDENFSTDRGMRVEAVFSLTSISDINIDNVDVTSSNDNYAKVIQFADFKLNGKPAIKVLIEIFEFNKPTTITARTLDGSKKTAKFTLKAIPEIAVKSVAFTKSGKPSASIVVDQFPIRLPLEATVSPANATINEIEYSSSNEDIAFIEEGNKLVILQSGKVTIKATATDGSGKFVQQAINISVAKDKLTDLVLIDDETQSFESGETYNDVVFVVGAEIKFNAQLKTKSGHTPINDTVTWKSSSASVAPIGKDGVMTPLKAGTVKVTATANDGSKKSASLTIKFVAQKVESFKIDGATLNGKTLFVGDSMRVTATAFSPASAQNHEVTWKVVTKGGGAAVAKIDSTGILTALKAGTAIVSATTKDGGKIVVTKEVEIVVPVSVTFTPSIMHGEESSAQTKVSVLAGDKVTLNSGSSLVEGAQYQWYENDGAVYNMHAQLIAGATSPNYDVVSGEEKEAKHYFVEVSGDNVKTVNSEIFTVYCGAEAIKTVPMADHISTTKLNAVANIGAFKTAQYSGVVAWYENTKGAPMYKDTSPLRAGSKFALDKRYIAEVVLTPNAFYVFEPNTKFDQTNITYGQVTGQMKTLWSKFIYDFEPVTNSIENYDLANIFSSPVAETAAVATIPSTPEYSVKLAWKLKNGDSLTSVAANSMFAVDSQYVAELTLTALSSYKFDSEAKLKHGTIEAANVGTQSATKRVVQITFPKTQQKAPEVILDFDKGQLTGLNDTMEYQIDDNEWIAVDKGVTFIQIVPSTEISVRLKGGASLTKVVKVPGLRTAPIVKLNFLSGEFSNSNSMMEYKITETKDGTETTVTDWTKLNTILKYKEEYIGKIVYFRYSASDIDFVSEEIKIIIPNAPVFEGDNVHIDFEKETIINVDRSMEYQIADGAFVAVTGETIAITKAMHGKEINIRIEATNNSLPSNTIKLSIPTKTAPVAKLDYINQTIRVEADGLEYATKGSDVWSAVIEKGIACRGADIIRIRVMATKTPGTTGIFQSDETIITAPKAPEAPEVIQDFEDKTFKGSTTAMEYGEVIDSSQAVEQLAPGTDSQSTEITINYIPVTKNDMPIPADGLNKTYAFRIKATDKSFCSKESLVKILSEPLLPDAPGYGEVRVDFEKETIIGINPTMEYRFNTDEYKAGPSAKTPVKIPADKIINEDEVGENFIEVRFKKTATALASQSIKINIPKRAVLKDDFLIIDYNNENVYANSRFLQYKGTTSGAVKWGGELRSYPYSSREITKDILGLPMQFRVGAIPGMSFTSNTKTITMPTRVDGSAISLAYDKTADTIKITGVDEEDVGKLCSKTIDKHSGRASYWRGDFNSTTLSRSTFGYGAGTVQVWYDYTETKLRSIPKTVTIPAKPVVRNYNWAELDFYVNEKVDTDIAFWLDGSSLKATLSKDLDVTSWITNIPKGLKVTVNPDNKDVGLLYFKITGTPLEESTGKELRVTVPKKYLLDNASTDVDARTLDEDARTWNVYIKGSFALESKIKSPGNATRVEGTQEKQTIVIPALEGAASEVDYKLVFPLSDNAEYDVVINPDATNGDVATAIAEKVNSLPANGWKATSIEETVTLVRDLDSKGLSVADSGKMFSFASSQQTEGSFVGEVNKTATGVAGISGLAEVIVSVKDLVLSSQDISSVFEIYQDGSFLTTVSADKNSTIKSITESIISNLSYSYNFGYTGAPAEGEDEGSIIFTARAVGVISDAPRLIAKLLDNNS